MSEPLAKDSVDLAALSAEVAACDMVGVVIRKMDGDKKIGSWFLLIYGNGEDGPISDHTDNDIGNHFFNIVMGQVR